MSRVKPQQKLFLVFLQMSLGGIREAKVKASDGETAGRRALKRVSGSEKVIRVEKWS